MFRALRERDPGYDGVFVAAIRTTGVFCRPTCTARSPNPENVEYFGSSSEAVRAGYRPCKRCNPLDNGEARPRWLEQLERALDEDPTRRVTDNDLRTMGLDPVRVRRHFKRHYGTTFHAFHRARRMGLAAAKLQSRADGRANRRGDLGRGDTIDTIAYAHGYESTSGFRGAFTALFGKPPGQAGRCACLWARWLETPLGEMIAVAGDDGLCLLDFIDRPGLEREVVDVRKHLGAVIVPGESRYLEVLASELDRYFTGELTEFTVPLVQPGSRFQRAVWAALGEIPYGSNSSYAELARRIGRPHAHRAVGRANGDNRIAIVVPCHRILRSDGSLGGYGGGTWRKRRLLEIEAQGTPASDVRDGQR